MKNSVLEQFLAEEAVPHVRKLIADAVRQHKLQPTEGQKRFEFNRFELTLDFANDVAVIEDILDPAASGEFQLALEEFLGHLAVKDAAKLDRKNCS